MACFLVFGHCVSEGFPTLQASLGIRQFRSSLMALVLFRGRRCVGNRNCESLKGCVVVANMKKIMHNMLCVTPVDISGGPVDTFPVLLLYVSHLSVCSSCCPSVQQSVNQCGCAGKAVGLL